MEREMLINVVEGHECRIAVLQDGVLQELYIERTSAETHLGNVYKGRVTNVEPGIQAAFVDYGAPKNGFLHISDLQPQYFPSHRRGTEQVGKKRSRYERPPIQECLRRGQEVIVQVTKEGIGTKGSTLTTYLSIPGRFLVMMPGMSKLGVSRKIEDDQERRKLRSVLEELTLPENMGFIIRTAGMDRSKKDLQNDLNYLLRLWRAVEKKQKSARAPAVLYQESDLIIRTIRDIYSSEIAQIICDNEKVARKVVEFLEVVMPRGKHTLKYYHGAVPLFHRYGLEREIEKIYARRVELPGGGSLVIDQTEAMVAIDVNSGRFREASNAEETAFRTNVTAAREIARQLRLRDMGGVIVIDFIDMREEKHRREVERTLRDAVKNDRARTKILKISRFGIIEMTRQRVRPSLKHSMYRECPHCKAAGLIKSDESLALDVMRNLQLACTNENIATIEVTTAPGAVEFVNNRRRAQLAMLERETSKTVTIRADAALAGDDVVFRCSDARGSVIVWNPATARLTGPTADMISDITSAAPAEAEQIEADLTDVQELPPVETARAVEEPADGKLWQEQSAEQEDLLESLDAAGQHEVEPAEQPAAGGAPAAESPEQPRKRRRRRGGRKHRRRKSAAAAAQIAGAEGQEEPALVEAEMEQALTESFEAIEATEEPAAELITRAAQNKVETAAARPIEAPEAPPAPEPSEPAAKPQPAPAPEALAEPAPPEEPLGIPEARAGTNGEAPAAQTEAAPTRKRPARRRPSRRRSTRKTAKTAAEGEQAQP